MILPDDVKCSICAKVFCCIACREKHFDRSHSPEKKTTEIKNISCPICQNKTLALQAEISIDLLEHIAQKHLPLHCKKCFKMYETRGNLLKFSNCTSPKPSDFIENIEHISEHLIASAGQKVSCSTQTSPMLGKTANQTYDNVLTPISMINLQWKAKNKISDNSCASASISSVKNISSSVENSSTQGVKNGKRPEKGGLVRSTSTPMQVFLSKPTENVFDSSAYQVSSIYASSSESDISPSAAVICSPASAARSKGVEVINGTRGKIKRKIVIATPLRQVISKSIQKAMAKHSASIYQDSFSGNAPKGVLEKIAKGSPLDLRTSPALRRSKSEIIETSSAVSQSTSSSISRRKEVTYSSKQLTTTHSVLVSASSTNLEDSKKVDTLYKTCSSVEVFTTEINEINIRSCSESQDALLHTPKMTGAPLKKVISFETPNFPEGTPEPIEDEVFYTPSTTPKRNVNASKAESKQHETQNEPKTDAVILRKHSSDLSENKSTRKGSLWSMVTSVIRLPSFGAKSGRNENNSSPESLVKRCASFAGSIAQPLIPDQQHQVHKRKRTFTLDGHSATARADISEAPPKRIKKIHGRKPIERLRKIF